MSTPFQTWTKVFASNNEGTSVVFTPTTTAPVVADAGVIDISAYSGKAKWMKIRCYGAGSDGNAFAVSVVGFKPNQSTAPIYAGDTLVSMTGALGTLTGVAGQVPVNTELWGDTLAAVSGTVMLTEIYSSAANDIATAKFKLGDYTLLKVLVNKNAATSINVEYTLLENDFS